MLVPKGKYTLKVVGANYRLTPKMRKPCIRMVLEVMGTASEIHSTPCIGAQLSWYLMPVGHVTRALAHTAELDNEYYKLELRTFEDNDVIPQAIGRVYEAYVRVLAQPTSEMYAAYYNVLTIDRRIS